MRQFKTILKFELKYYFKNKIFVGLTIAMVALIGVLMFFPRIAALFQQENEAESAVSDREIIYVMGQNAEETALMEAIFGEAFADCQVLGTDQEISSLEKTITAGEAECAFVMTGPASYTYYVNNLSMYDTNTAVADELLKSVYQLNSMVAGGFSPEQASEIMTMTVSHEIANLGKDQAENFFYTYIMIFALYMVIMMYGQMVATNVATEKSSRAMEVLITSANPVSMMFGKVIASCLAGLIQLLAVFGSAILFYNMNLSYWGDNPVITSMFDMPVELFVYMLIFFVLGFFIYAFLFGAIGSTASKLEDINTSVMPLILVFVVAFMVVIFSMTEGSVDNMAMRICSYVPFTSPMAMFTRIAMSTVPFYEILISIVILVASVVGVGVLSAKIYRVGVLLYGTTPRIGAILKAIRNA